MNGHEDACILHGRVRKLICRGGKSSMAASTRRGPFLTGQLAPRNFEWNKSISLLLSSPVRTLLPLNLNPVLRCASAGALAAACSGAAAPAPPTYTFAKSDGGI